MSNAYSYPLKSNTSARKTKHSDQMRRATESPENGCINLPKLQLRKRSRKAGSRSTSQDQDSRNSEYATAVLAAAFAIHSLEEAKTPKKKENKVNGLQLQPHTNEVTRRLSYNKTKSAGDKPSRSSSFRSRPAVDLLEKVKRQEKLNSVLAWANGKKMKAKSEEKKM